MVLGSTGPQARQPAPHTFDGKPDFSGIWKPEDNRQCPAAGCNALVVRSNGFRDGLWLDSNGSPMTDAATITERFRRPDYGTLEITLTVDDPKAYTRPWTTTMKQVMVTDSELLDYVCVENERSVRHFRRP